MEEELEQLTSYKRRIRELVLMDTVSITPPDIAPETLARLALIQDPKSPFLPSLECLRLIDADQSLSHLFFCIAPCLKSLEIVRAPSARGRQIAISSFLKELVIKAPGLSNITFCGRVSETSLQSSLKFSHLRQLHLIDAAHSLDFTFLQDVSALPELESFVLDVRTAEYKQRLVPPDDTFLSSTSVDIEFRDLSSSAESQMASATNLSPVPFCQLRKLAITGSVLLMEDLISYLSPRAVKEISLTLVRHLPDSPTSASGLIISKASSDRSVSKDTEGPVDTEIDPGDPMYTMSMEELKWILDQQPRLPSTTSPFSRRYGGVLKKKFTTITGDIILLTVEAEQAYRDHLATCLLAIEQERTSAIISETSTFVDVVEKILAFGALDSFTVDHADMWSQPSVTEVEVAKFPFQLPSTIFETLLSSPTLKKLKIAHWALPSMENSIINSTMTRAAAPMSMQRLQLPVDTKSNSGIMTSTLDLIARYYPRLIYLECFIQIPPAGATQFDEEVDITPHGLEVLSVGGAVPHKIPVATHLSLLFPHLKAINTHEGYDEEDWQYIHSLVKMCRTVTLAAEKRFHRVAH